MKRMKQLAVIGSTLALLLTTQAANAQQCCPAPEPCCDPCLDWCNFGGDWEFGAHALIFSPTVCEFDYATTENASNQDSVSTLHCPLDWGFRVFGTYLSKCSFTGLSYQWFQSTAADSVTGVQLVSRQGNQVNRTQAKIRLEYQNVDFRMGKFLHRACGCAFYVFGNVRWVDLEYKRAVRDHLTTTGMSGDIEINSQKSKLQGGALGIGTGADFDLWCDVGIFGEANILGVIAERSTTDMQTQTLTTGITTNIPSRYGSNTCINPELDFRLGLNYTYTCGCWTVVGEIGYELDYFWNAFAVNNVDSTGPTSLFRKCEDVGFSGLFFGGRLLF